MLILILTIINNRHKWNSLFKLIAIIISYLFLGFIIILLIILFFIIKNFTKFYKFIFIFEAYEIILRALILIIARIFFISLVFIFLNLWLIVISEFNQFRLFFLLHFFTILALLIKFSFFIMLYIFIFLFWTLI